MRNIVLFDNSLCRTNLLPITFTRPISEIRFGILTIREKWERLFEGVYSYLTVEYLSKQYPLVSASDTYFIAANYSPSPLFIEQLEQLSLGSAICVGDEVIAYRGALEGFEQQQIGERIELTTAPLSIAAPYDIFMKNGEALEADFRLLTAGRTSAPLSSSNRVVGDTSFPDGLPKLFIEEGATVECATLNLSKGAIYIGKDAEIMEGAAIRAPFAACEHAVVNMGGKIYGATTLGPYCKVGGELNNVVMIGYSNKAHDGFIGNAVVGMWCNLGAGCTASNLKNNYAEVKLWNYGKRRFIPTGLQFCGLIMGDHSKAGINTMFNTATVVGVGSSVYGAGFPRIYIPSFVEGGTAGFTHLSLKNFYLVAERVMARRGLVMSDAEKEVYSHLYEEAMKE